MKTLKRSQKLCPNCKDINPIRCFNCKNCNYQYPQKEKKVKENTQLNTLDVFLKKKQYNEEIDEHPQSTMNNIQLKITENNNDLIVAVPQPQRIEASTLQKLLSFTNELNEQTLQQFENSKHFEYMNDYNLQINNHDNNNLHLLLDNNALCTQYSFHYIIVNDLIYTSILYLTKHNDLFLCLNTFNKLKPISRNTYKFHNETSSMKNISSSETYYFNLNTKILHSNKHNLFFYICSINNSIYCLYNSSSHFKSIFTLHKKYPITKIDSIYLDSSNEIKLLLCDSYNKLFYYNHELASLSCNTITLMGIYENLFQNRITDIHIIHSSKNYFYFAACSRDGLLKLIDNNGNVLLKHKTYQTWITQIAFDISHDTILFLTNFEDKIVGAKLSGKKEPIIKRIPNTTNPYYIQVSERNDKVFYLDMKGNVYYIKTIYIEDMFKTNKSKIKNEYEPQFISEIKEEDHELFLNKINVITMYDKANSYIIVSLFHDKIKFELC